MTATHYRAPRLFLVALVLVTTAGSPGEARAQTLLRLAEDPLWLSLLHVNRGATLHGRHQSYVDDDAFFLHPDGKRDPAAELWASVTALAPAGAAARCRFPARYRFLAERLGWPDDPDALAHCSEFLAWRDEIPRAGVSLVFPAAYLGSPSSMFGHTLLRFDRAREPDSVWDSWAVTFGADTRGQETSLLYIYRGLFGGYPGYFITVPYVTSIRKYSHLENRDMWEYRLALEAEEIERLVDHLWELRDIRFDYYFLDENCSFRLLELIEVARPGTDLLRGLRVAEVPVNTVRTLRERALIEATRYRPSKAVELRRDIVLLSAEERRLAAGLLRDPDSADTPAFRAHAPERRHLMARVAYRTLRHRHRSDARDPEVARRSLALLRLMHATPAPEVEPPAEPEPPERGHGTQMVMLGAGQRGALDYGEIGYRFTYHDLLDNGPGFLRGAQIGALDLRLRSSESAALEVEHLDVVHIRSLAPRDRFVRPVSWIVRGGLERVEVDDRRRLARFVQGGVGVAAAFGDAATPYAFVLARLENNGAWAPWLQAGAGARVGSLWQRGRIQLDVGVEGIHFGNDAYRHRWNLDINLALARDHALRLGWQREGWRGDGSNEFGIAWRHYFD